MSTHRKRPLGRVCLMALALAVLFLLSFVWGRYDVPLGEVVRILLSRLFPLTQTWTDNMAIAVHNVRLPRILMACLVGGVPEPHGRAGHSGRVLGSMLRRGAGHPAGTGQRHDHDFRLLLQPADGGAGLPHRQPYQGQQGSEHPVGRHHGGLAVLRRHLLH